MIIEKKKKKHLGVITKRSSQGQHLVLHFGGT